MPDSSIAIIVAAGVFLVVVLVLSLFFNKDAVIKRAIKKAPRSDIGAAPEAAYRSALISDTRR